MKRTNGSTFIHIVSKLKNEKSKHGSLSIKKHLTPAETVHEHPKGNLVII